MKKLAFVSLIIFAAVISTARAADDWLPNFEDVPMMEQTYVIDDSGFVYSQPEGKIAQTTIASDVVSRRKFQRFYTDAMYELGWKNVEDSRKVQIFEREGEQLKIEIIETDPLSARFTLTPFIPKEED